MHWLHKKAWESKKYFHILYYNHGSTSGLSYNYKDGDKIVEGTRPVEVVFNTKFGYSDYLTICCCHYDKVVTEKKELDYMEAKIQISTIPVPQNDDGTIWRSDARNTLLQLFKDASGRNDAKLCR